MDVLEEFTKQLEQLQLEDEVFLRKSTHNQDFSTKVIQSFPSAPSSPSPSEVFPGTKEELANTMEFAKIVPSGCFELCSDTQTFRILFAQLASIYLERNQLLSKIQTLVVEVLEKKRDAYQLSGIYLPFDSTTNKATQKINKYRSMLLNAVCAATAKAAQQCFPKYFHPPSPVSEAFDFTKQYRPRRKIKVRVPIPPEARAALDIFWDTHLEEDGKCYITVAERAQLANRLQLKEGTVAVSDLLIPYFALIGLELFSK